MKSRLIPIACALAVFLGSTQANATVSVELSNKVSDCGTGLEKTISQESLGAALVAVLAPKLIDMGINALSKKLKDASAEKQKIESASAGFSFYKGSLVSNNPSLLVQCIKIMRPNKKISGNRNGNFELYTIFEVSPDYTAFRLLVSQVRYVESLKKAKRDDKKRNVEVLYSFILPGNKPFGSTTISLASEPKLDSKNYISSKVYSRWLPMPAISDNFKKLKTAYTESEAAREKVVGTLAMQYAGLFKATRDRLGADCRFSNSAANFGVNKYQNLLDDLNVELVDLSVLIANTQDAGTKAKLQKKETNHDNAIDYLKACLALYPVLEKRDAARNGIESQVPFDLEVSLYESEKKPILKFFSDLIDDDGVKSGIKSALEQELISSKKAEAKLAKTKEQITANSNYWTAKAAADLAVIEWENAAAGADKNKAKVKMDLEKRKANAAAVLADLPMPFPELSI